MVESDITKLGVTFSISSYSTSFTFTLKRKVSAINVVCVVEERRIFIRSSVHFNSSDKNYSYNKNFVKKKTDQLTLRGILLAVAWVILAVCLDKPL